ncbi:MAG: hypothetical protein QOD32_1868 [Pyrinomonadaceae bacterium]|jgi:tetratricopeptide (TPR) repeat protein|nr:hypothetical protein [Pyrinomonadaceae bacterium]
MNRTPRLALLALAVTLTTAPVAVSLTGALVVAAPKLRAPQDPQKQPGQGGRKNPPPGARGFEQFAGRDAADKLIKGAATRRFSPAPGISGGTPRTPTPLEVQIREAEKQRDAGNFDAAVVAYKKAIELRGQPVSDDGALQYALGKVYSRMERYEEAAAEFRHALSLRASGETALYATYELGNAELDLGKYAEAVAAYEQTIKMLNGEWKTSHPNLSEQYLPYPHYSKGLAHLGLKQKKQAVADFEKAIALKPDFAEAYFNLGLTLWQSGRADEARATQVKLKALKPELAERLAALFTN